MKSTSEKTYIQLRISQAYLKLLTMPENADGRRMVSLQRIGNYEIRLFETASTDSGDGPLFWMEIFNHDKQSSVDSCICYEIGEAATALDGFVSEAKQADDDLPSGPDQPQS
jgi:hypothetical protein